jgi:hypothetical protein
MVKKEKVSPIKLMAHYWLTIPRLKKGGVILMLLNVNYRPSTIA